MAAPWGIGIGFWFCVSMAMLFAFGFSDYVGAQNLEPSPPGVSAGIGNICIHRT
jgi:hypothetical protein